MTPEAERHRRFAATFGSVAERTRDWDAASPVKEWRAADVVEHLLDWLPPVLRNWCEVDLPPAPGATPAARFAARAQAVQELLEHPQLAGREVAGGPFAGSPLDRLVDRIYTTDVYLHTWDLARAGGFDVELDPQYARDLLTEMRAMESVLRESGQFGAPTHTDSDQPVDRLMAFIGRQV